MQALERGLVSGFLATGPMTYFLMNAFKWLPEDQKSPLPPAILTDEILKFLNVPEESDVEIFATLAAHFGYGAVTAVPYSLFFSESKVPTYIKGAAYGVGVWAGSYFGLIPALGMRARGTRQPLSRHAMMILAHVVWGTSVAESDALLSKQGKRMFEGHRKAPDAE